MIEELKIKNFALLKSVTINFANGFNVLIGETGAGKSIILDALNFALGSKADKELIRIGEDQLRIEALFKNYSKEVDKELEELGIEKDDNLIISRTLNTDGKQDIRINGNYATLTMLKSVSKYLADSYSQQENLILLKPKNHLGMLDNFNESILAGEKQKLTSICDELRDIKNQVESLGGSGENRERMIDLYKFQIDEIESLKPSESEEKEILEKFSKFNNSEKIANGLTQALSALDGSEFSSLSQLKNTIRNLGTIENYSDTYKELNNRLKSAMYEMEDISSTIRNEEGEVSFNENEFEMLDSKIDKYKSLKKKYGGTIENVLKYLETTKKSLDEIMNAEQKLAKLEERKTLLLSEGNKISLTLSEKRKALAKDIEEKIKFELQYLGIRNAQFVVSFKQKENFDCEGFDDVEFLFSANAGIEPRPLAKIISGGEMSRFSLAMKNIIKEEGACLLFDEIDSGISGEIGKAVGERIAMLSRKNQVICISHSPQVCAMADNFEFVSKQVENGSTFSSVSVLSKDEVISELAKMSSGKILTDISLAHAKELVDRANEFKKSL